MPETSLRGEFVDLVPLRVDHAELTFHWRQDTRARHLNRGAESVAAQRRWIASRPDTEYNFVITLRSGLPVGMVALINIDLGHRHAEPGRFLIGDESAVRGRPAAVEAMKLVYQLAFDELGLQRVHGSVAEDNGLMMKWQKFLGMREEGRLRRHFWLDGRWQDAVLFGLLEEEYRQQTLPRMNALIAAGRPRRLLAPDPHHPRSSDDPSGP
jgi:RimJ/RimL family protein N-acetyltransferase